MADATLRDGETLLAHLVWAPLGTAPLGRFVESYGRHAAGAPHTLLVIFNGFAPDDDLTPWRELLADVEHSEMRLERAVLDLAAYVQAAARIPARRYCFVNSYCEVRGDGWLGALHAALDAPGVGLVGPCGSWGSVRSYNRFMLGLGGPYAAVFADRKTTTATLARLAARHDASPRGEAHAPLEFARALLERSWGFLPYPAAHIRTSAFMIDAVVLRRLQITPPERKADALRLESGRRSFTMQVKRLGLRPLVVGRDGRAYEVEDWPSSHTFWQGDQENLLISDKQTGDYQSGDPAERTVLSRYAWGTAAAPKPPDRPLGSDRTADR